MENSANGQSTCLPKPKICLMSTPKANRPNLIRSKPSRRSCISRISAISVESLDDWSVISSTKSRISLVDKSLKRVRRARRTVTKRLKLSSSFVEMMRKSTSKLSESDFKEVSPNYPSGGSFNGTQFSRIVSEREIQLFDDYDLVVWEATPEKKSKKKNFLNMFRKLIKFSEKRDE